MQMDRFDKFTERARKVLTLAQEEAQRFDHNYIGAEHLLLGLIREGESIAAGVLGSLNVDLKRARETVVKILTSGAYTAVDPPPPPEPSGTPAPRGSAERWEYAAIKTEWR